MTEKHFVWDEVLEGLILASATKTEDEQIKRRKKLTVTDYTSEIYCPHAYLILNYQETLNDNEKIKFRKYYLRKVTPTEADVIILQDVKDLVLYLLATPHYVAIWEDLMQERAATMKKAPNPLARGHRTRYAEEMHMLRCVLGREYVDLILGCQSGSQYHHMMTGKRAATIMQSQGEKDLRIFEVLISVAHRVVWIALQRKYYTLIELELHRLLRTEAYNTAQRQSDSQIIRDMLEDDIRILHGPKSALKRRLLRNSPLTYELINSDCDYRLLSLGVVDITVEDPKILYLKNALFIEEEMLPQLGIKVGILGHNRSDYDIMLMPSESEQKPVDSIEISSPDEKITEIRKSISIPGQIQELEKLPSRKFEYEIIEEFPVKEIEITDKYDKIRKEARRKWILREKKRHDRKPQDTYSLATTLE